MRGYPFWMSACLFLASCQGVITPDEDPDLQSSATLTLIPDGLELNVSKAPTLQLAGDSVQVTIPGLSSSGRVGEPRLPFRTVRVLLPFGQSFQSVEVVGADRTELKGFYHVESARLRSPIPVPSPSPSPPSRKKSTGAISLSPRSSTRWWESRASGLPLCSHQPLPGGVPPAERQLAYYAP